MSDLNLRQDVLDKFNPFLDEILNSYQDKMDSVYMTGSALTEDFDPKTSDINSVVVLKIMDLDFLSLLSPLGKKYGKKGIAAPLIMTPEYIRNSLDVFPIEFLNIKLLHHTIFGTDIFPGFDIKKADLRYQCEREIKVKLIGLRQGYIKAAGDRKILNENIITSITAYLPLFRGILFVLGKEPPLNGDDLLSTMQKVSGIDTRAFQSVLRQKKERSKLSLEQLHTLFEDYYNSTEKLGEIVDAFTA